uniref:Uncharacterized protein n=1 Tax=Anguilla anguilla TaxID=7936 RepID=A0A0E9T702_ANGAN
MCKNAIKREPPRRPRDALS